MTHKMKEDVSGFYTSEEIDAKQPYSLGQLDYFLIAFQDDELGDLLNAMDEAVKKGKLTKKQYNQMRKRYTDNLSKLVAAAHTSLLKLAKEIRKDVIRLAGEFHDCSFSDSFLKGDK